MKISSAKEFILEVSKFGVTSKYVVVKPNWVSDVEGEFSEPEILDWLFTALPNSEKIVIESHTPWRGHKFSEQDRQLFIKSDKRSAYRKQDQQFLKKTGIGQVLERHHATYINITDQVWNERCVDPKIIQKLVEAAGVNLIYKELYSYVPQQLFAIRDEATFISLAKIKTETSIPNIMISMSVKNLFGLIPDPSRHARYHGNDHAQVHLAIKDINAIYNVLFSNSFWITEGIRTLVNNYRSEKQEVLHDQNLCFMGSNGIAVDTEACRFLNIDPEK